MQTTPRRYRLLQPEDRLTMASLLQQRHSLRDIALVLQRSPSTITDLSGYSQEQLDAIADEVNNRPRKGLGVRSPLAVYTELLMNTPQHATLIH